MVDQNSIENIAEQIEAQEQDLPPVEKWNPPLSGDIDIVIARDGKWYHEGSVFEREKLVQLFASILIKEGDEYFLVTPVEKWRIRVEDLPFVATQVERLMVKGEQVLKFTTNTGDQILAGEQHPIIVEQDENTKEPKPRINVRRNLDARIHRNVFYQLVEWGEEISTEKGRKLVIKSNKKTYVLGEY